MMGGERFEVLAELFCERLAEVECQGRSVRGSMSCLDEARFIELDYGKAQERIKG
jgi:hypothetical protein